MSSGGSGGAAVAGVITAVLLLAAPAASQDGGSVSVRPSTVPAGQPVEVHASCDADRSPATVSSGAFGELVLTPQPGARSRTGTATVPPTTPAGEYRVDLHCADGATASAELFVLRMAQPTRGPDTGGGTGRAAGTGGRTG